MDRPIDDRQADRLIAAMVRGEDSSAPLCDETAKKVLVDRIVYHGVAGLLVDQGATLIAQAVAGPVRDQAVAQAMWEIRHRRHLGHLIEALVATDVNPLILKGTALAYDLYANPAARARGDSDILIRPEDLTKVRAVLVSLGFEAESGEDCPTAGQMQEVWTKIDHDGPRHDIDLHWRVMNSPTLQDMLPYDLLAASARALPALHERARGVDHVYGLIHAAAHRAMSFRTPYIVDGVTYYGGSRLIWAKDIDLLAGALDDDGWERLYLAAAAEGVGPVCLDGLTFARDVLGTFLPAEAEHSLADKGPMGRASNYLLSYGQAARAISDLKAVDGWRAKLRFLRWRGLPSGAMLRGKYPSLASRPLILLYLRRLIDLFRPRPEKIEQ